MNGSGTDSLEIRHTPRTVPGGARPGWGLPFEQLPAATRRDLTPESVINKQITTGRQQIQDRFALQWNEINRSAQFIGRQKASNMRRQLHTKAKQEMLQFNQQAQQQMAQLQNINRLAEQGMITNPDEIKARVVFGADVARSMYPTPEREQTIEQEFGALELHRRRIESRIAQFGREKKRIPSVWLGKEKEAIAPGKLEILDQSQIYTDEKGVVRRGVWRSAIQEEATEYRWLLSERKRTKQEQADIFKRPDISRRVVQPGTKGGTFGDKIAKSVRPQQQRTVPKSKVIRQRSKLTGQIRESRDGGKTWMIISG